MALGHFLACETSARQRRGAGRSTNASEFRIRCRRNIRARTSTLGRGRLCVHFAAEIRRKHFHRPAHFEQPRTHPRADAIVRASLRAPRHTLAARQARSRRRRSSDFIEIICRKMVDAPFVVPRVQHRYPIDVPHPVRRLACARDRRSPEFRRSGSAPECSFLWIRWPGCSCPESPSAARGIRRRARHGRGRINSFSDGDRQMRFADARIAPSTANLLARTARIIAHKCLRHHLRRFSDCACCGVQVLPSARSVT